MRLAVILSLAAAGACGSESVEVPPPVDAPFTALTGGWLHTCAMTTTKHVYCWGWNRDGEVGDGSTADRPYAKQVSQSFTFTMVTTGGGHSCAVATGGAAYCWGLNLTGQIGDSSVISRSTPTAVTRGLSFAQVSNGGTFTCGITATDSSAYCWGWNHDGELGSRPIETCLTPGGVEPCSRAPIPVGGGLRLLTISAGARHVCALAPDSTAYCWGNNGTGQLGNGTTADTALPVAVSGGLKFKELTLGFDHSCGLTAAGDAYCWGENASGQLGAAATETCTSASGRTVALCSHLPLPVSTNQIFGSIFAGGHHTCAITTGGKAYCWGENSNGQLGTGNTSGSDVPVLVANQP